MRKDYKTFKLNSEVGFKSAERYKEKLYKKYDDVKVKTIGVDKVAIWGV